jgi:hypothetical protein
MVPNPSDFGTLAATFGNHRGTPDAVFRGGDLWIRYPNGTLKNLTAAAGYGTSGFQGATAIAVRDPAVHWDGEKVIFSMIVGAPTQQYQLTNYRWQLYEITGLGSAATPVIAKVANQPESFNNVAPAYASDDSIIFSSDRPRDDSVLHTYPQRDEYESSPVTTGLWKIHQATGELVLLDHSPSGDFNPIIDSFGRVVFTRWDHLQRDQQNVGASMGAFNYESEEGATPTSSALEVFPEPRSMADPDKAANTNLHSLNQFFPWAMNQDGTDLETLNHVGRQEIGLYSERSFNDDSNVQEFYGQYTTGQNQNEFTIFLHIKEDPTNPGRYVGTNCQEFATHASGQLLTIDGPPGMNPDAMLVQYLTHPDTAGASNSPSPSHSGLYRDPLPLSNGKLIASHTTETREDSNIGSFSAPQSRYAFRLKLLTKSGSYFVPSATITSGISKSVSFWSPDQLITYNGPLWEMMAVEVKSRPRPSAATLALPSIESAVLTNLGVSVEELTTYLKNQNLALVISRNLTVRDRNDRQQPTNLRVEGGSAESIPHSGKVYDISQLQFFQGDLIRGYSSGNQGGRRVIAQPMHSVGEGINPEVSGAPAGSVKIAEDGSMAAFVPARRALTWHMSGSDLKPVVRERYWVTFQPGEIRVCSSCHGVNTADHLGNPPPTNSPLALQRLLEHWKGLPPGPTPTPKPGSGREYSLTLSAAKTPKPRSTFSITATGGASDVLTLQATINGQSCVTKKSFASSGASRSLRGRFPALSKGRVKFSLLVQGRTRAQASARVTLARSRSNSYLSQKNACAALIRSLKRNE